MEFPKNYLQYPNNVFEPQKFEMNNKVYTVYGYRFRGLQDFYDFLKSNPKINFSVWTKGNLASEEDDYGFAGIPYDKAVEKLIQDMDPGYQEYISVQKNMRARMAKTHEYKPIKSVAGGVIDPVEYITGSPTIYRTSRLITRPKFITINNQVAYNCSTSKAQVFNRALIITSLIRALEKNGYNVNVNSFMVAINDEEIIKASFEVKQHGGRTNYQALYKSLVDVEFFRRLCFRLIEISDVKSYWPSGYGRPSNQEMVRRLFNLKKEDIYFDQPHEMGIRGSDVGDDFQSAIKRLHLENSIDVEKEKKVLKESIKVLRK